MTDIFTDTIDALNSIVQEIANLPTTIMSIVTGFITALFYPIALTFYYFDVIFGYVYEEYAQLYNIFVNFYNIPVSLLSNYFVLPPLWTMVLMMTLSLSLLIRSIKWLKWFISWLPTFSNGGQG